MQTRTKTYTEVNIRKVGECFAADLSMLALRTKTMTTEWVNNISHDITLMAIYECLATVHVQLIDSTGKRIAAHVYEVGGNSNWDQNRPGANNWPSTPGGEIVVIVSYSDMGNFEDLENSGRLHCKWTTANLDTKYRGMKEGEGRQYSSGSYGWTRKSYTI